MLEDVRHEFRGLENGKLNKMSFGELGESNKISLSGENDYFELGFIGVCVIDA